MDGHAETGLVPAAERLDTLMVIVPDRLSQLVTKGEIVPRYYNPGNLFRNVHIVTTTDDAPDPSNVQRMVGDASLTLHSFASGAKTFLWSAGWQPWLLHHWAAPIVELARKIHPAMIRCHGNQLNTFAAAEIKRRLGIPYVASLHINPDIDCFRGRRATTLKKTLLGHAIEPLEIIGIQNADFVIAVYSPIVPYLRKHGVARWDVIYNAVGYGLRARESYALDPNRVRAICIGRQDSLEKNPVHILEAVADLPSVYLTLVGNGDLNEALRAKAAALGLGERAMFFPALPNQRVLELLTQSDFLVYSTLDHEVSKVCLEAALAGLPIVHNARDGGTADELIGSHVMLVPDTREGYRGALQRLIGDGALREGLGRAARDYALAHWRPEDMERRITDVYRLVVAERPHKTGAQGWANSSKR